MKDFDEARRERELRERSFKIGGETFTFRPSVSPEALLPYHSAITGDASPTEAEWVALYDETIVAMLDPGQGEQWKIVRNPEAANPLNASDISGLLQWLIEQVTARPTGEQSGSSTTSGGNGDGSTGGSSSTEDPASADSAQERLAT